MHPNQEDKSGNPPFGSPVNLNFSTNESRGQGAHTWVKSVRAKSALRAWLEKQFGRKKVLD